MSYDCEMPEFFNSKTGIKARKQHRCCECAAPINMGELHYRGTGVWGGDFQTYRQHLACKEACVMIRDFNDGECISFGELREYWREYVDVGTKDEKAFRSTMARILYRERRHRKQKETPKP